MSLPHPIRTLALIGKENSLEVADALRTLLIHLRAAQGGQLTVWMKAENAMAIGVPAVAGSDEQLAAADVAIVLGGDGTLLSAGRRLAVHGVPLVGINQGRLGFMTDIARADMLGAIDCLLAGEFTPDTRMLLEAQVWRDGARVCDALALNDVVVHKGDTGRLIELEVRVDDESLHVLRADGMIVATPTGSTGYALSANGPILHPAVPGIALVPLCPHALTHRPITISSDSRVEMVMVAPHEARVHFDGQTHFDARAGDSIRIRRSAHVVTLLHPPGYSYFAMLREKLHWSATPRH